MTLPSPTEFVLYKYSLKLLLGVAIDIFSTFDELLSGYISEKLAQLKKKRYS